MKPRDILLSNLLVICCLLFGSGFRKAHYMSGEAIINQMKQQHATESEVELIKMVTIDEEGNTQIKELLSVIKADESGNLRYLIRFLSPKDIRGVTLLTLESNKSEAEQYLYLPALGIPRQIMGSQKSGYFMGSDFTFEDLRKENVEENAYHRLMDDQVEGKAVYTIMSAPANVDIQNTTGYENRILYIDKETFDILKIEFYEEGQEAPIKTFQGYDYNSSEIDGETKRPQRAVMNHHGKKTTSIMTVLRSRLNKPVSEEHFTVDALKSWQESSDEKLLNLFQGE